MHAAAQFDLSSFRFTVVEVNKTGKPVFGLENGVEGLGIRGVVPVMHDGKQIGSVEVGTSFGKPFLEQYKKTANVDSAFYLKTDRGFDLYASTFAQPPALAPDQLAAALERKSDVMLMSIGGAEEAVMLAPARDYKGAAIGVQVLALDRSAFIAAQDQARLWSIAIGAVMLALTLGLAWLMHRSIARPIRRIGEVLIALAHADTRVEIPYTERGDEIGDNARAAQAFRDNIARVERLETERRGGGGRREWPNSGAPPSSARSRGNGTPSNARRWPPRRPCTRSSPSSRAPSAESSTWYPRPQPRWRRPPAPWPVRPTRPSGCPMPSRRPPATRRPTSSRLPRRPSSSPHRSARSASRCSGPATLRATPSPQGGNGPVPRRDPHRPG